MLRRLRLMLARLAMTALLLVIGTAPATPVDASATRADATWADATWAASGAHTASASTMAAAVPAVGQSGDAADSSDAADPGDGQPHTPAVNRALALPAPVSAVIAPRPALRPASSADPATHGRRAPPLS
jgi:hypothetical protein